MKPRPTLPVTKSALALGAALAAGCVYSDDDHDHAPVLWESEPNDGACCADDFGVLAPGDFLAIHGWIDDDGFDLYDGFAFTAWGPISVEFRLFAAEPGADLDVCLYDPQLGIIVDCFESPFNPETGVAHVLAGGADFHLVVSSFAGDSAYTLELEVFPLYLAAATAPAQAAAAAPAGALVAGGHALEEKPDRRSDFAAYHSAPLAARAEPFVLDAGELLLLDPASGDLSAAFFALTSEGTMVWMGNPDEERAAEGP